MDEPREMTDFFYRDFEAQFRGDRSAIIERLQVYVPFLTQLVLQPGRAIGLDLGCGRGEWLEVMSGAGLVARGVDLNEGMLSVARDKGLAVEKLDALTALRAIPDGTLAVVSAFHLIEHLHFDVFRDILAEARRTLRPGGIIILETPNPENPLVSLVNFYLDPTHIRPLPPALTRFAAEHAGFFRTVTLRLHGATPQALKAAELSSLFSDISQDYAVIAQTEGDSAKDLDQAFSMRLGMDLSGGVQRFDQSNREKFEKIDKMMNDHEAMIKSLIKDRGAEKVIAGHSVDYNKIRRPRGVLNGPPAHIEVAGSMDAKSADIETTHLHSYWIDALSRAIAKKDYHSILIASQFLLRFFPDDLKLICSRQAALISLGKAGSLGDEFYHLSEKILEDNDLAINYFDYLFHEKKFGELFYHIFHCSSQESLKAAGEYMLLATEKIQHVNCVEMSEAEANLSCRAELPLYERIVLSFTQQYEAPSQPDANRQKSTLYLQIDVLLRQIAAGGHATGIQRAMCEMIKELPKTDEVRVFFFRPEMNYPVSISSSDFLKILNSDVGRDNAWNLLFGPMNFVKSWEVNGFMPLPTDKVVLLDCFWACPIGRLAAFLDECQCETYLMIYDLIPLTLPGEPADAGAFEVRLEVLETRVDKFLAISDYSRTMVERYLSQKVINKKCISVPLAQQRPSDFRVFRRNSQSSLKDQFFINELLDKPFILTVSTISARKRILETAEAFQDTFESCPEWVLVIVGHDPGHDRKLTDALLDVCQRNEGRIVWLRNVGDDDLDRLYRHCEFVTYLSRNEGWGLPIGEALAYGKLPLVHRESSIPEVGGDLAVYCDSDRQSVSSAMTHVMQDELLRKRVEGTNLPCSLRTWRNVAGDFLRAVSFEAP